MRTAHTNVKGTRWEGPITARPALPGALVSSLVLSATVAGTAFGADTRLGAPTYWPWLLTGLQVLALWAAGDKRWWGWLLGASVQPPWIACALVTGQLGFIPGCAVSAAVQAHAFIRSRKKPGVERTDDGLRHAEIYT